MREICCILHFFRLVAKEPRKLSQTITGFSQSATTTLNQLTGAIDAFREQSAAMTTQLSDAINNFNQASVTTLSSKLQSFIDSAAQQAQDAGTQSSEMINEGPQNGPQFLKEFWGSQMPAWHPKAVFSLPDRCSSCVKISPLSTCRTLPAPSS